MVLQEILLSTPVKWKIIIPLVKILVAYDNPQITKARNENFKPGIKEFIGLSMFPHSLYRYNNFNNSNYHKQLIFTRSLTTDNKNNSKLVGNYIEVAQEKKHE